MKVAFITIHVGINVGSNLQAIATSESLKKAGHDPILINYIPPRVTYKRIWREIFVKPFKTPWRLLLFPFCIYNNWNFNRYLSRRCVMSDPIFKEDDFISKLPAADLYLVGSDQVWNFKYNEGHDSHYFYSGVTGRKVAYASSIGIEALTPDDKSYLQKELKEFEKVSVREDRAVDILKSLGINSVQLIDPTLMLDKFEWTKFMSKKLVDEPYVLVYLPYNIADKEKIYKSVKMVADRKKLKIVTFSWDILLEKKADKTIFFASPGDFLSLMYYADYVITNSFHGTAFSINLNKKFWTFAPSHFSTRISSLANLVGLQNRIVNDYISVSSIDEHIQYDVINRLLEDERKKSLQFLGSF